MLCSPTCRAHQLSDEYKNFLLQQLSFLSFNKCYFHSGLPHVTNFTLADVSWLLDYFDNENQLIVVTNESLINNSTYLVGELPKNLEVSLASGTMTGTVTVRRASVRGVYITYTGRSLRRKPE
jgi:hypothetical protein